MKWEYSIDLYSYLSIFEFRGKKEIRNYRCNDCPQRLPCIHFLRRISKFSLHSQHSDFVRNRLIWWHSQRRRSFQCHIAPNRRTSDATLQNKYRFLAIKFHEKKKNYKYLIWNGQNAIDVFSILIIIIILFFICVRGTLQGRWLVWNCELPVQIIVRQEHSFQTAVNANIFFLSFFVLLLINIILLLNS